MDALLPKVQQYFTQRPFQTASGFTAARSAGTDCATPFRANSQNLLGQLAQSNW